jgi:TPP-dependent 2-oxoacid decarboxylase
VGLDWVCNTSGIWRGSSGTGASFGLVTGEGSHQLTAQEISQFGRRGLKPIVFVLNNSGYMIERLLCKNPDSAYNDLALWHYSELPRALGCDGWFTARVTTCGEFDQAFRFASFDEAARKHTDALPVMSSKS